MYICVGGGGGRGHFQKVPYLIVFNLKSWRAIWFMTAFLQCFWIFTKIGFASFGNLMSSFGEVYDPFCTVFLGASFIYFSKFSKYGTWFSYFQIPDPRKSVFWPGDVFCTFLLSKKSLIYLPYCIFYINLFWCRTKVFPMNLPVNMALALFQKQL